MDERNFALEERYLGHVIAYLRRAIEEAERSADDAQQSLLRERENMWEHNRHVVRDLDDAVELFAHSRVVELESHAVAIRDEELQGLKGMMATPYFARIDFWDEVHRELLNVYIGRRALIDREALAFYVYDWRSPIASMFYDFDAGPAFYQSPGGRIEGELRLKRQFRIEQGELVSMFDANALVQDEFLGQMLSQGAGHSLKVIAESVQREQNQAIRFLAPRNMLVLGPAGSGKTSVGLHHVAYLLYHNRERLASKDILAVSANHAFNEYIAGVLPELYESDIRREVFSDIIAPYLPKGFRIASYYDQAEYLLSAGEGDVRTAYIQALYSQSFVEHMRDYLDALPIRTGELRAMGEVVASEHEFARHLSLGQEGGYQTKMLRADHFVRSRIEEYFALNRAKIKARVEREAAESQLDLYTDQEMENYIKDAMKDAIQGHLRALRMDNDLSALAQLPAMLQSYIARYGGDPRWHRQLLARIKRRFLYYEDALALLCVRERMGLIQAHADVRYVLVDEAQDYGFLQHHLLRALYPNARFTLLADTGQAVIPCIGIAQDEFFDSLYAAERFVLDKSYRSTGPIGALSASLISDKRRMTYFEREGEKPACVRVEDIPSGLLAWLGNSDYSGSTAIITGTRAAAQRLFAEIGKRTGASLVTEETDVIDSDLVIIPLYFSKGLEFDRVLAVLDGDRGAAADAHNMLYLYATRALHRLAFFHRGEMPELLKERAELLDVRGV